MKLFSVIIIITVINITVITIAHCILQSSHTSDLKECYFSVLPCFFFFLVFAVYTINDVAFSSSLFAAVEFGHQGSADRPHIFSCGFAKGVLPCQTSGVAGSILGLVGLVASLICYLTVVQWVSCEIEVLHFVIHFYYYYYHLLYNSCSSGNHAAVVVIVFR